MANIALNVGARIRESDTEEEPVEWTLKLHQAAAWKSWNPHY